MTSFHGRINIYDVTQVLSQKSCCHRDRANAEHKNIKHVYAHMCFQFHTYHSTDHLKLLKLKSGKHGERRDQVKV